MKVLISVDVEVWCNGWKNLEGEFPAAFDRYVYGRSAKGAYGLPRTLELLGRHGLHAVFFVEPLFAARFGLDKLARVVDLIRSAGQEVQLHLHPEWTDEARAPLLPGPTGKRQHLFQYDAAEQTALIGHGRRMLEEVGAPAVRAFRAGSFACNRDTYAALAANGIHVDGSLNATMDYSGRDVPNRTEVAPFELDGVRLYPMSAFVDGWGRVRHAQVGACSFEELRDAMEAAHDDGWSTFVILSHNFELLRPGSVEPDGIVERRFARLCSHLEASAPDLVTVRIADLPACQPGAHYTLPRIGKLPTTRRLVEQVARRLP